MHLKVIPVGETVGVMRQICKLLQFWFNVLNIMESILILPTPLTFVFLYLRDLPYDITGDTIYLLKIFITAAKKSNYL